MLNLLAPGWGVGGNLEQKAGSQGSRTSYDQKKIWKSGGWGTELLVQFPLLPHMVSQTGSCLLPHFPEAMLSMALTMNKVYAWDFQNLPPWSFHPKNHGTWGSS